jgi:hypothetical protein
VVHTWPVILALGKLRQECGEFGDSLQDCAPSAAAATGKSFLVSSSFRFWVILGLWPPPSSLCPIFTQPAFPLHLHDLSFV